MDVIDGDSWQRSHVVLDRAREILDSDRQAALVTLVGVEGSAYRRPGAKRLLADTESTGTVVPGCLDARLDGLAESVLDDGEATTARFDLREDDTWGLGVGCDGVVTLLVEPLDDGLAPALDALDSGRTTAVVTVLDAETSAVSVGDRAIFESGSSPVASDLPAWLDARVGDVIEDTEERAAGAVTVERLGGDGEGSRGDDEGSGGDGEGSDGDVEVFVDWFEPPPKLVVFGTGPDVDPLVEAARFAGFRPTVVSFRGEIEGSRFPAASTRVSSRPAEIRAAVEFDADTAAIVATHNFVDDRLTVEQLLATPIPYIGVVGSRERFERLRTSLECDRSASDRDRLYGPAGLDIGGETPEQIALSVVTEALAVCNDRQPAHLRERERPIHERSAPNSDRTQQ